MKRTRNTNLQDTLAVIGLAWVFYLMIASVTASKEPDWPLFWLACAMLVVGVAFFGRAVRLLQEWLDDWRASHPGDRFGSSAD